MVMGCSFCKANEKAGYGQKIRGQRSEARTGKNELLPCFHPQRFLTTKALRALRNTQLFFDYVNRILIETYIG